MSSNFSRDIEERSNRRELNKSRKEKLAGYFFNLSQLTYTALVLGFAVLFLQGNRITTEMLTMLAIGVIAAYGWAKIGNNILK